MGTFLIGSKIALAITGKQMESYENLDQMGKMSVSQIIYGVEKCYKMFLKIPFKDVYSMNPNKIVRFAFLVGIIVLIYSFISIWMMKKPMPIKCLISVIMVVLPIAINLVAIMSMSAGILYSIMLFELVYMFVIPIACLEALRSMEHNKGEECNITVEKHGIGNLIRSVAAPLNIVYAIAIAATVVTYIWFANGNYLEIEYTNNYDNAFYQTLMTQIKSVEGYNEEMSVATIGVPSDANRTETHNVMYDSFNIEGKGGTNIDKYSSWNIMTRVLGFDPVLRDSDEDEKEFMNNAEIKNMPNYPADGSIRVIDNTVIVKFQDFDEIGNEE